jgi:hypothetical protein
MVIEWMTHDRLQWNQGNPVFEGSPLHTPLILQ